MTRAARIIVFTTAACVALLCAGTVRATQTPQEKCDSARITAWKTYLSCVDTVVGKDAGCMLTGCQSSFHEFAAFAKCRHTYFKNWAAFQKNKSLATSTCQPSGGARYTNNSDGTVTDNLTTLQWEQKTGAVGGGGSGTDQDNVNNTYAWSTSGTAADGPAFTTFLPYLDGGEPSPSNGCLGAQCDWRLPTMGELQSIVLDFPCTTASCSCGSPPCIDATFGPTQSHAYYSATTYVPYPDVAWFVDFTDGAPLDWATNSFSKIVPDYVRAVRGGFDFSGGTGLASCAGSLTTVNAGTAAAGDVLSSKTFSSRVGIAVTGSMPNNGAVTLTPGTSNQTIATGYHNGSGYCAGDGNLVTGNIKNGATIFGVSGSVIQATGTAPAGDVLSGQTFSNASGPGIGTMPNNGAVTLTPTTTNQTIAAGYHNGSGYCAGNANLVTGNIKSGATIFGVSGNSNVVNTSGATATASNILSGQTCYANGSLVTGSVPAGANVNGSNGSQTFTIPDGLYSGSKTATADDTNLVAGNIVNGVGIFGVTGTAGVVPAQPLRTGLTQCDQGAGTMGNCPGSPAGQDGALLKGSTRNYTDNGDGTITDNKTGLTWEKLSSDGSIHDYNNAYTWYTAFTTKIAALNSGGFAGHTDWRLPNRFELQTLIDVGRGNPPVDPVFNTGCVASCTVTSCSCTQTNYHWSSSTIPSFPGNAWIVAFDYGDVNTGGKSGNNYSVRAVRGGVNLSQIVKTGQTTSFGTGSDGAVQTGMRRSFTDNGDGTITDNATGLMWEKKDQSGGIHDWGNLYTWSGASYGGTNVMDGTITTTFLATLNAGGGFAGHTDWRIPNRFELESIVNLQNVAPSVDTVFNTSCAASCTVLTCSCTQAGYYWSSSTYPGNPTVAWFV